jgi:HopJ type III effector protein
MRFTNALVAVISVVTYGSVTTTTMAFTPSCYEGSRTTTTTTTRTTSTIGQHGSTKLYLAEIRGPTDKSDVLRFGWDGTTALGGAVEVAKPARMLDAIRAAGETIPSECDIFNSNVEMDSSSLMIEAVLELINEHYETQLLEYTVGDVLNKQGENEKSGQILSYAALSNLNKDTTLKLFGQHYRSVLATPDGTDHANIRNFMKYGWDGVPFENGIALTRKNNGDNEWDAFAESWIP